MAIADVIRCCICWGGNTTRNTLTKTGIIPYKNGLICTNTSRFPAIPNCNNLNSSEKFLPIFIITIALIQQSIYICSIHDGLEIVNI